MEIRHILEMADDLSISVEDVIFIEALLCASVNEEHREVIQDYYRLKDRTDIIETLQKLKDKKILASTYKVPQKGEEFAPDEVIFSAATIKKYYICSADLGSDLLDHYPTHLDYKGTYYPLTNISKKYNSIEEFCYAYARAISFSPAKHKEIIELLEWANERFLITFGITEFVISKKWLELSKMRENGYDNNTMKIGELL